MSFHSRRSFLRAALLGGGAFATASLMPAFLHPTACAAALGTVQRTSLFMGTIVDIRVANISPLAAEEGVGRAFAAGRALADVFSRFDAASPVSALNSTGLLKNAPRALTALARRSLRMSALTKGAFDVTVLPLLRLLEARSNPRGDIRLERSELRESLELVGAEHLHLEGDGIRLTRSGMGITLDGIAKGHIADAMSQELMASGCANHLVNAGGDIVARGKNAHDAPWRVGVEDPGKRGRWRQVVRLDGGGAVATSGVYEIFYDAARNRSHLLNPATGQSSSLVSVTATAPDGLTADALATALAVMPPQEALALADSLTDCACCLLRRDGTAQVSARWRAGA